MRRDATTLDLAVTAVLPLVLSFALHLLLVGHDEPGGGFAAGLLVAGALSLRAISRPREAHVPRADALLGGGLVVALIVAVAPMLVGEPLLSAASVDVPIGALGTYKLSTVLLFDIGVLMVVVGLAGTVLDRVREVLT